MSPSQNEPLSVTLTREFDAPIDLVYAVWTEPHHVSRWMKCSETASLEVREWTPVEGARFETHMVEPGAFEWTAYGRITEVDPPHLLAYAFDPNPGLGVPEMTVRVIFEDLGQRTRVTLTQTGMPNDMIFGVVQDGWTASFRQLGAVLSAAMAGDS